MASVNIVVLLGNLTRDPTLKFTPGGSPVATFGLAVNDSYKDKQGEKVDKVNFFNVTCWAKLAETVAEYLQKGSQVHITGKLQYSAWETEDGQIRSKVEVVAQGIQFLGGKGKEKEAPSDISLDEEIPF